MLSSEMTVKFAGSVNVGAGGGCTHTRKNAKAALPCASVALHCTVVTPFGNVLPEAGAQIAVMAPSTASVVVTVYVTTFVDETNAAGTVITGGVVSTTRTEKLAELEPKLSVAVHVTGVEPSGKSEPEG